MKRIPLTPAGHALLDDEDYEALIGPWTWGVASGGPYASRRSGGRTIYMHRVILGLDHGDPRQVDHVNRNGLDNRRVNLRIATVRQNAQNQAARSGGTSRFRGVYFNKHAGRWMARVKVDYRHRYLGLFDDEVEAARVAEAFRREHMPFATPDPELLLAYDFIKEAA